MKFKNYLNEVMGYKLKAKDRKIIAAFIDGDKDGEGKALYIDDPGNGTTELKGGMSGVLATRDGKGYITIGRAYGNVSQTWINAIRKMTPKAWLKEDINEAKKPKQPFKVGDKVKIAPDALKTHSKTVPASMGYTTAEFSWRKSIDNYKGKVGTVTQVFASGNTDVDFGKGIIMMQSNMLVKA